MYTHTTSRNWLAAAQLRRYSGAKDDPRRLARARKESGGGKRRGTGDERRPGRGRRRAAALHHRPTPPNPSVGSTPPSSRIRKLFRGFLPDPRLPGGRHRLFDRSVLATLPWRVPPFLAAAYLLVHSADADDERLRSVGPCAFRFMSANGPSMLPTIYPMGDIFLADVASHRLPVPLRRDWRVGDVVIFAQPGGGMACKRLVGLPGQLVRRCGEHVELYADDDDVGVRFQNPPLPMANASLKWETGRPRTREEMMRTAAVPPKHVWLEGDSPLHSSDSRHYGPVHLSALRGRLVTRIWPLLCRERSEGDSLSLSHTRPNPIDEEDLIARKRYNLHEIKR